MPRKDHCSTLYGKYFFVKLLFLGRNMVVVGGTLQNGQVTNEILNFDLDYHEWSRIVLKTPFDAVS